MTLNFAHLGTALANNTYQVYLCYLYKDKYTNKNKYEYIPSGKYLPKKDIEFLKADMLGGRITHDLYQFKDAVLNYINNYFETHKFYPSKETILTKLKAKEKTVLKYVTEYRNYIKGKVKSTTYETYTTNLQNLMKHIQTLEGVDKKPYLYDVDLFVSEATVERVVRFYIEEDYKNGYIIPIKRLLVRFINFIRKERGLPKIKVDIKLSVSYSHYYLTEAEIQILLDFKVTKRKYVETQDIIRLNSLLGLRISEILSLHLEDFQFHDDHIMIRISETKKSRGRELAVADDDHIKIIKQFLKKFTTGKLFSIDKDSFNYHVMRIAKDSGQFNDEYLIVKNIGADSYEERKKKFELISSHSFRRFKIMDNMKHQSVMVAQYYSGHKNLNTLINHYSTRLRHDEVIDFIKKRK